MYVTKSRSESHFLLMKQSPILKNVSWNRLFPLLFLLISLLPSPQFGKDLVSYTARLSPLHPGDHSSLSFFSLFSSLYPSSYPSTHPLIATIPGLCYPSHGQARVSLPTTQLCAWMLTSEFFMSFWLSHSIRHQMCSRITIKKINTCYL